MLLLVGKVSGRHYELTIMIETIYNSYFLHFFQDVQSNVIGNNTLFEDLKVLAKREDEKLPDDYGNE